jgi:hypothetical protein
MNDVPATREAIKREHPTLYILHFFVGHFPPVAELKDSRLGDKINSGIGLSYQLAMATISKRSETKLR